MLLTVCSTLGCNNVTHLAVVELCQLRMTQRHAVCLATQVSLHTITKSNTPAATNDRLTVEAATGKPHNKHSNIMTVRICKVRLICTSDLKLSAVVKVHETQGNAKVHEMQGNAPRTANSLKRSPHLRYFVDAEER